MYRLAAFATLGIWALSCSAQQASPYPDEGWWATVGRDGVQRVYVRCGTNFIDPVHIVVKANLPVQLIVTTESNLPPHNFVINVAGPHAINAVGPVGAVERPFTFVPGAAGEHAVGCQPAGNGVGVPLEKAKQSLLTVIQ